MLLVFSFQLLGVALNGILWPGDIEQSLDTIKQSSDEKYKKIFTILYTVSSDLDIFNKYQVYLFILSFLNFMVKTVEDSSTILLRDNNII